MEHLFSAHPQQGSAQQETGVARRRVSFGNAAASGF